MLSKNNHISCNLDYISQTIESFKPNTLNEGRAGNCLKKQAL